MSAAELVVVAVLAFFTIGVVVGVIAVIAMSAIRRDQIDQRYGGRAGGLGRRLGGPPGDDMGPGGAGWGEPPEAPEAQEFDEDDEDDDDRPPRWPGGSAA